MRIIAGKWKSRRLRRPSSATTRPMPDRVREAIFDILGSHFDTPGALPELRVLDLFAGSGAMGLESLSRGAVYCCFVERDRKASGVLMDNLKALEAGSHAVVSKTDAWRAPLSETDAPAYDVAFLDPPYRDAQDDSERGAVRTWFNRAGEAAMPPRLVVLHHFAKVPFQDVINRNWKVIDHRVYGTNSISFVAHDCD